jgi:protein-S-isoprenylcysteine O-methyltransferase Ste14
MELLLGYIAVGFTIYRMISYQMHQRWHAVESRGSVVSVSDAVSSRLLEVLYAAIYAAAAYGVFIAHTRLEFIIAGLACMTVAWVLRQTALKDLGKNYGHEITLLKNHQLVQHGIYDFMRHPLYFGLCLDTLGAALMAHSLPGWLVWVLFLLVVFRRIPLEDATLREKFGDEGKRYQERVPAILFWPRLRKFYKR